MRFPVFLFFSASLSFGAEVSVQVRKAVFSQQQLFWPKLGATTPETGRTGLAGSGAKAAVRIGVLPIQIRQYQESIPCDSCHRLSPNGMEFFLENYLAERMRRRFPGYGVELLAPHLPLVETGKINLMAYLDSLKLPWAQWFDGYGEELIYRPRDRMTSAETRRRLDKLGGQLGMTHLLLPARAEIKVVPRRSDTHEGSLDWSFHLLFWNVVEGRPEWAMHYSEKVPYMDLNQSLEGHLDRGLLTAWDKLPQEVVALWQAEPR